MDAIEDIAHFDPELWAAVEAEALRQEEHIELIASENYASSQVMALQSSVLTNKYAEGYVGKRYYGGCEHVDVVETLAIARAKKLFGASYANVQPHSGSQANAAVYLALLAPGDKVLGMSLDAGGHLTHGSPVNFSGKIYQFVHYGVDAVTGLINFDEVRRLAETHRPKMIVAGFSAYSRKLDWQKFRDIADDIGAYFMVDMAHVAGLVAADLYPNPVPVADVVTTTTHKTLAGPRGGMILSTADKSLTKKISSAVFPGGQGGPLMHVIAAKALCLKEALEPEFKIYQQRVIYNAKVLATALQEKGYDIVSGGTDNHLVLVDLTAKDITGKAANEALGRSNMVANKNAVPADKRPPFVTSGLRLGTPATTRRGFKEAQMQQIASWIDRILLHMEDESVVQAVRDEVLTLCRKYPVYPR